MKKFSIYGRDGSVWARREASRVKVFDGWLHGYGKQLTSRNPQDEAPAPEIIWAYRIEAIGGYSMEVGE